MKQTEIIVYVLRQMGGEARYDAIYNAYEQFTKQKLTYGQKAGIRKNIETHSSDSKNYNERNEDIFYAPKGLGKGCWALREKWRQ